MSLADHSQDALGPMSDEPRYLVEGRYNKGGLWVAVDYETDVLKSAIRRFSLLDGYSDQHSMKIWDRVEGKKVTLHEAA